MNDENADPDELGAELRRLFADGRIELRPTPGAGRSIVAGARRRRRRRSVLGAGGATLAVAVLVAGGFVVGGPRSPGGQPETYLAVPPGSERLTTSLPPPPPTTVTQAWEEPSPDREPAVPRERTHSIGPRSASPSPPTASPESGQVLIAGAVLGPDGYRTLKLGMPFQNAVATGMLAAQEKTPPTAGTCTSYRLAEGTDAIEDVTISGARGIVSFRASGAQTAEGIAVGSPVERLRETYPDLTVNPDGYSVPASAGRYQFTTTADTVTEVRLIASEPEC